MVNYPQLSLSQQQGLPALLQVKKIAQLFEDSTHQLWQCHTVDGDMMLKVCDEENVKRSSFWQGMSLLFAVDLPQQLGLFSRVYDSISEISHLDIPDYIAANSADHTADLPAFILAKMISGTSVDKGNVDDDMIASLAKHLSRLHQRQTMQWGSLLDAPLSEQHWPLRLHSTLETLAEKRTIPPLILGAALHQAKTISSSYFSPIMLDLRWDQFLHEKGKLSALVDLDAIVIGPRELELVILEYFFTQQQANVFRHHYQQSQIIPDLSSLRTAYRLLLFLMNILGENDVDTWMHAPTRFN